MNVHRVSKFAKAKIHLVFAVEKPADHTVDTPVVQTVETPADRTVETLADHCRVSL